jgi:hypothetical protein
VRRAVLLLPVAACSFDPTLIVFDGELGQLDASLIDGKPDAGELDAPPIDLDAPDGMPRLDSSCVRFGVPCTAPENLEEVSGDEGEEVITRTGNGDTWFFLRVNEDSDSKRAVRAHVRLEMPADVDFDLHALCGSCGTGITAASENTLGVTVDELTIGNDDKGNGDASGDTFDVLLHLVHYGGDGCGNWTLTITGNVNETYHGCN